METGKKMTVVEKVAGQLEQNRQDAGGRIPGRVEFVYPRLTQAVSCTGTSCSLNCAHCGGHYLKGMVPLDRALQLRREPVKSFLVSGGCDSRGRVPHLAVWEKIAELSRRGSLNLHTGLVEEGEARRLGRVARTVSFDFVADEAAIKEVYGLAASPEDYVRSYRYLRRYCRVVPHICLGILAGKFRGEYHALEVLKKEGVAAISFIVFRPTPETRFAGCRPPSLEETGRFLVAAREMFPDTPLYLGCLRPGGLYREELDSLAIRAGFDKIVHPSPAARELAVKEGMEITMGEECCAL